MSFVFMCLLIAPHLQTAGFASLREQVPFFLQSLLFRWS